MSNKNILNPAVLERQFSFQASFITGKKITVIIADDDSFVGYTMKPTANSAKIVISSNNTLLKDKDGKDVSDAEKAFLMEGVLAHECLHQVYTDFEALDKALQELDCQYQGIFAEINNILEDPAIEYASADVISGRALNALDKLIQKSYKMADKIEDHPPVPIKESCALGEILNAFIQVGDRGKFKGKFTDEAFTRPYYEKAKLSFDKGILCSLGATRVLYAKEIFDILLPLIDAAVQSGQNTNVQNRSNAARGTEASNSNGSKIQTNGAGKRVGRWKKSNEKMSDGEEQKSETNGGKGKSDSTNEESENNQSGAGPDKEKNEVDKDKPEGEDSEGKTEENESKDESENKDSDAKSDDGESDGDGEEEETDIEPTEEELKSLVEELEKIVNDIEAEEVAAHRAENFKQQDVAENSGEKANRIITNIPTAKDIQRYEARKERMRPVIASLVKSLKDIFQNDISRMYNSDRGAKINIKRAASPTLHTDILLKRKDAEDVKDTEVCILVDNSGSMSDIHGGKKSNIEEAKDACMAIFETLYALKVPVMIASFTTGIYSYSSLHNYYVTWHSLKEDKYKMEFMKASGSNMDFYAIEDATKALKKRKAKHKLLIVISDGAPCGNASKDGVVATGEAVEAARRNGISVLGVALNCYQETDYKKMYKSDYIKVETAAGLTIPLTQTLKGIIKNWSRGKAV